MSAHPNHRRSGRDGALLAGVCAGITRAFNWNVWVLRILFIGFLAIKTLAALITYAVLALVMLLLGNGTTGSRKSHATKLSEELASPELSERGERIADLERRFREMEDSGS